MINYIASFAGFLDLLHFAHSITIERVIEAMTSPACANTDPNKTPHPLRYSLPASLTLVRVIVMPLLA